MAHPPTCPCGHVATKHTKDGCAGIQRLTPWDSERCICTATEAQVHKKAKRRTEAGNSCLTVIVVMVALLFLMGACVAHFSGSDDCGTTGDPGSAQYDRDVQHCIEGD